MSTYGNILLVEDSPSDEGLVLRALKKHNIDNPVTVARDGQEAVDYLFGRGAYEGRDIDDLPVLILLDLKLPKLSGLEVLQCIRKDERTKLLPIVILTSSTEDRDIIESYRLGANSYVSKPVEFQEFSNAIKQLGLYWIILNKNVPRKATTDAK